MEALRGGASQGLNPYPETRPYSEARQVSTTPASELVLELNELRGARDVLQKHLSILWSRLQPVIGPRASETIGKDARVSSTSVRIVDQIRDVRNDLNNLTAGINELLSSLDL